eukprot:1611688-Pleurochrysis_carterae.AAC.4
MMQPVSVRLADVSSLPPFTFEIWHGPWSLLACTKWLSYVFYVSARDVASRHLPGRRPRRSPVVYQFGMGRDAGFSSWLRVMSELRQKKDSRIACSSLCDKRTPKM